MKSSEKNFKFTIQYLGTPYRGWQFQPNCSTIQGEIEIALKKIFRKNGQNINLTGSGRTDSGVHALGQVANIKLDTDMSTADLKKAINANIENNIFIKDCVEVNLNFNSRFSAKRRCYVYKISNENSPFIDSREWFNDSIIDIQRNGYSCKEIPISESIWALDSTSLKYATAKYPVWYHKQGGVHFAPVTDGSNAGYVFYKIIPLCCLAFAHLC